MKVKVITVATDWAHGLDMLTKSLSKFNIDHVVLGQNEPWKGFGTKVIKTVEYLKTISPDYTHFVFVDAFDVVFLSDIDSIKRTYSINYDNKIVFSTEKGCWPDSTLSSKYPECTSPWKYLNSGSYMAPIKDYLELIEKYPPSYADDDQAYFTKIFFDGHITLDTQCRLFQSIAFKGDNDFELSDNRLYNLITGRCPPIIHGNGKTDLTDIYELL